MAETKEIRELPKEWHIKVTPENKSKLEDWRTSGGIAGIDGYVHSHGIVSTQTERRGYWDLSPSYGELITNEEFDAHILGILPEKWVVERNEGSYLIINEWLNCINPKYGPYAHSNSFVHFPKPEGMIGYLNIRLLEGYTKIPFSLFKRLVFDPWKELDKFTITREHEAVVIPETLLRDAESAITGERLRFFNDHFNPFRRTMSKSSIQEYYQRFACDGWKDRLEKEFPFLKPQLNTEDISQCARYLFSSFGCTEGCKSVDSEGWVLIPSGWDLKIKDGRFKLEKKPHQRV